MRKNYNKVGYHQTQNCIINSNKGKAFVAYITESGYRHCVMSRYKFLWQSVWKK